MGVQEMWPVILVAGALWLIVYCLIVAQRCSAHTKYANDASRPSQLPAKTKSLPNDSSEKALFAYYL
ncbi:unnamed protein product [Heligmosomoides polygyrus]|uniref:Uncharacterized protein n=1 Tax=Heligmosomoides polygyrus TaxID=6339 RepID=A0A183FXQ7_HELPZ|nr:unnamed protein product [Heligmosomoides polygyrus]